MSGILICICVFSIGCALPVKYLGVVHVLVIGQSNAAHYVIWDSFEADLFREGYSVSLIHAAQGSTRLIADPQDWMPPDGSSYARMVDIYVAQKSPSIDYVIWHQGEGDAAHLQRDWYGQYNLALTMLIESLRTDIRGDWKFLAGSIAEGDYASIEAIESINEALMSNDLVDLFVSFEEFDLIDGVHYGNRAEMGRRWAEAVISLIKAESSLIKP